MNTIPQSHSEKADLAYELMDAEGRRFLDALQQAGRMLPELGQFAVDWDAWAEWRRLQVVQPALFDDGEG